MSKVLLVEDNDLLRDMYSVKLELSDVAVCEARNAQEALDILDEQDIDLIILDMLLPHHNGIMVLQELQSYADWRKIPIIVLSSVKQSEIKMKTMMWNQLNVKKYLYKPRTKPVDLVTNVKQILDKELSYDEN